MVDVVVEVITVTAYKCAHCDKLFSDRDSSFEHLDKCSALNAQRQKRYVEDAAFGDMVLREVAGC
jgi:DNA-directed RNA polymerase subunit RPC12/RpoP